MPSAVSLTPCWDEAQVQRRNQDKDVRSWRVLTGLSECLRESSKHTSSSNDDHEERNRNIA